MRSLILGRLLVLGDGGDVDMIAAFFDDSSVLIGGRSVLASVENENSLCNLVLALLARRLADSVACIFDIVSIFNFIAFEIDAAAIISNGLGLAIFLALAPVTRAKLTASKTKAGLSGRGGGGKENDGSSNDLHGGLVEVLCN